MKQITITMYVSPEAAVREGKVQCGDVQYVLSEDDLASMTNDQRDTLARHLAGEYVQVFDVPGANWKDKLTDHAPPVSKVDRHTVISLLDTRRAKVAERMRAHADRNAAEKAKEIEALRKRLDSPLCHTMYMTASGEVSSWASDVSVRLELPTCPSYDKVNELDPDLRARFEHVVAEIERIRRDMMDTAYAQVQANIVKKQAEEQEAQARRQALYARLPAKVRERDEAGFASAREIDDAIRDLVLSDAGLTCDESWRGDCVSGELTDAEFASLKTFKAKLPSGAKLQVLSVWNYRPAECDEEGDDDGEVGCDHRKVATATWMVADVTVDANMKL